TPPTPLPAGRGEKKYHTSATFEESEEATPPVTPSLQGGGRGVGSESVAPDVLTMLRRLRDLALLLRKKRFKRGALELTIPEAVLEYDADGRVSGAHFAEHNLS